MYDTIHLEIRECDLDTPISFIEEIPCYMDIDKKSSTDGKIVCWLENIKIEIAGTTLRIKGSLTKWYKNNNIYGLEFNEVEKVIKGLGKVIGVPLEKAKVKRIDIAQTFKMKYEPRLYFSKLYYLKGFSRSDINVTSLYFNKESKRKNGDNLQLCLYDKNVELSNSNGYPLVDRFVNLLRYEFRIKNPKYIFKREIRCFELFSGDFYRELIKLWYDMYNSIEKRLESLEDYCEINLNGKKDLYETCLRLCVMAFDMEREVDIASKKGKVTAQNKSNVLKKIKEIKEELKKSSPALSMIDELNDKVRDEYKRQEEEVKRAMNH